MGFGAGSFRLGGGGTTPNGQPWLLVAADNAEQRVKDIADFVCDGIADDVEIQDALDTFPASGGFVLLSNGTFTMAATLEYKTGETTIEGSGATFITIPSDTVDPFIRNVDAVLKPRCKLGKMRIVSSVAGNGVCFEMADLISFHSYDLQISGFNIAYNFTEKDAIYCLIEQQTIGVSGVGSRCISLSGAGATNDNVFLGLRLTGDVNTDKIFIGHGAGAAEGNKFYGCHMDATCLNAVHIGGNGNFNLFSGCWLAEGATTGIRILSGGQGNHFSSCIIGPANTTDIIDDGENTKWESSRLGGNAMDAMQFGDNHQVTVIANAFPVTTGYHTPNTSGAPQTVDNATPVNAGRILLIRASSSNFALTINHAATGVGEFLLNSTGRPFISTNARDLICFIGFGTTQWLELFRSDNA